MTRGREHASKAAAVICLVAFLLLGISTNVHTHDFPVCRLVSSNATSFRALPAPAHHCAACDLMASDTGPATFSPAFSLCPEPVDIALIITPTEITSPAPTSAGSTRAPPLS